MNIDSNAIKTGASRKRGRRALSVKPEQFVASQWINFAFKLLHDGNRWDSSILEDNGDAKAHTC